MKMQDFKVYAINGRNIVYVPAGRGEELFLHLAAHGIESSVSRSPGATHDRLDLDWDVNVEVVQAILDEWER